MKRFLSSILITGMIMVGVSLTIPSAQVGAQGADYSCGSYGAGNYSTGEACNSVTAPNTGFAKLAEPAIAIPLGLSILAIVVGIILLVKRRRKRMTF